MNDKSQLIPAYVLQQRPFRDTSLLLDVFTQHEGRLSLIARGARTPKSKWRGILQPFQPLLLGWRKKGDLGTLTQAETAGLTMQFQGETLFSGFYLNELLQRLVKAEDQHEGSFELYHQTLLQLAQVESFTEPELQSHTPAQLGSDTGCLVNDIRPSLRSFEKQLLDKLGYGVDWTTEANHGQAIEPQLFYRYEPNHGLVQTQLQQGSVTGAAVLGLAHGEYATAALQNDYRVILQSMLNTLLGHKPLNSRKMLLQWRNNIAGV